MKCDNPLLQLPHVPQLSADQQLCVCLHSALPLWAGVTTNEYAWLGHTCLSGLCYPSCFSLPK
jgi:hypothetical protein